MLPYNVVLTSIERNWFGLGKNWFVLEKTSLRYLFWGHIAIGILQTVKRGGICGGRLRWGMDGWVGGCFVGNAAKITIRHGWMNISWTYFMVQGRKSTSSQWRRNPHFLYCVYENGDWTITDNFIMIYFDTTNVNYP